MQGTISHRLRLLINSWAQWHIDFAISPSWANKSSQNYPASKVASQQLVSSGLLLQNRMLQLLIMWETSSHNTFHNNQGPSTPWWWPSQKSVWSLTPQASNSSSGPSMRTMHHSNKLVDSNLTSCSMRQVITCHHTTSSLRREVIVAQACRIHRAWWVMSFNNHPNPLYTRLPNQHPYRITLINKRARAIVETPARPQLYATSFYHRSLASTMKRRVATVKSSASLRFNSFQITLSNRLKSKNVCSNNKLTNRLVTVNSSRLIHKLLLLRRWSKFWGM